MSPSKSTPQGSASRCPAKQFLRHSTFLEQRARTVSWGPVRQGSSDLFCTTRRPGRCLARGSNGLARLLRRMLTCLCSRRHSATPRGRVALEDRSSPASNSCQRPPCMVWAALHRRCSMYQARTTFQTPTPCPWGTTFPALRCRASRQKRRLRSRTTADIVPRMESASPPDNTIPHPTCKGLAADRGPRNRSLADRWFRRQQHHLLGTQTPALLNT